MDNNTSDFMGKICRDRVTGFKGVCTGKTEYIYGRTQLCLSPQVDKNYQDFKEPRWFDIGRIEVSVKPKATQPQQADRDNYENPAKNKRLKYYNRLYKVLKSCAENNDKIELNDSSLKTLLGCCSKYDDQNSFRNQVLKPAINKINAYSDIRVSYIKNYDIDNNTKRKRITGYCFDVSFKH